MSELRSVLLAIDVATQRRDTASQELGHVDRAQRHAQQQLEQLENYAAETNAKWTRSAAQGTAPELMFHHFQFMERLHHAIGLQHKAIADAALQVGAAKQVLLQAEFRLMRLNQLLKTKRQQLDAAQARREQKQTDEFATHQYLRSAGRRLYGELS